MNPTYGCSPASGCPYVIALAGVTDEARKATAQAAAPTIVRFMVTPVLWLAPELAHYNSGGGSNRQSVLTGRRLVRDHRARSRRSRPRSSPSGGRRTLR